MKLAVVIPSYPRKHQERFLGRAMRSVVSAAERAEIEVEMIVAVDSGDDTDYRMDLPPFRVVYDEEDGGQASATNAAMKTVDSDWVAFLEDDDYWARDRLMSGWLSIYTAAWFFSSNSLEITDNGGEICRVNDFPIPSGWLFERCVWDMVGEFDAQFRVHHDNEWLGRLAQKDILRAHVVESTAPIKPEYLAVRPWLRNVLTQGGRHSFLHRSLSRDPLVVRSIHEGQGEARLKTDSKFASRSHEEYHMCMKKFGRIPW